MADADSVQRAGPTGLPAIVFAETRRAETNPLRVQERVVVESVQIVASRPFQTGEERVRRETRGIEPKLRADSLPAKVIQEPLESDEALRQDLGAE